MAEEKKRKKREKNGSRSASGSGTGESTRPASSGAASHEDDVREVPIGIPMDDEEFRKLKAQAEQAQRDEGETTADEDATAQEED